MGIIRRNSGHFNQESVRNIYLHFEYLFMTFVGLFLLRGAGPSDNACFRKQCVTVSYTYSRISSGETHLLFQWNPSTPGPKIENLTSQGNRPFPNSSPV